MIVTVTMNPAIDKTAELYSFQHAALNRLQNVVTDAGGKGINVSKTIRALGGETVATGFIGGQSGAVIRGVLEGLSIRADFVEVQGETRTNLKVVEPGGILTELNEPGFYVQADEIHTLMDKLEGYAAEDTLFILSGSIPAGVDSSIYHDIIKKVKAKGAKVFLDADGALFAEAVPALPDIVKPNDFELKQYFGFVGEAETADLAEMGKKLQSQGIGTVIISMGSRGALFLTEEQTCQVRGLKVEAHSTVGAGDAMVAAFSYALSQGQALEECIRSGVAASAGAVMTVGTKPPEKELVEQLKTQVIIEKL